MQLKEQQQQALDAITDFIADRSKQIFILKGYAGTGKTTLLKTALPCIEAAGKRVLLMAPTGRAARVLQEKTGYDASTIHRTIYTLNDLKCRRHDKDGNLIEESISGNVQQRHDDNASDDVQFFFALRNIAHHCPPASSVIVVDESSLISSLDDAPSHLHFGSDNLLRDLLSFAQLHNGSKVIFVGDPAQLPPVGDNRSAALDDNYFAKLGLGVTTFELTQVLRQDIDSCILKNAMKVRDLLQQPVHNELVLETRTGEVEAIAQDKVIEQFTSLQPCPAAGESIVVCYSNRMVHYYNRKVREHYFPQCDTIAVGDVLQVVKNNLNVAPDMHLYNGDFVTVAWVDPHSDTLTAPVWQTRGNEKEKVDVTLHFRNVKVVNDSGDIVACKIIEDLLYNDNPSLTNQQNMAMFINFMIRNSKLRNDKSALAQALRNDPYYNALNVKFGYAITAHKSQGGEWRNVIVDYTGRTGLDNDSLRWNYTATTRATQRLWGVNMPCVTPLNKMTITPQIKKVKSPYPGSVKVIDPEHIDALPPSARPVQRAKYLSVSRALQPGYSIEQVIVSNYNDAYVINTPLGRVTCDLKYNNENIYTYYAQRNGTISPLLLNALRSNSAYIYDTASYSPRETMLAQLHALVMSQCDELGITVTGIVEETWKVTYGLITSGSHSHITFWYNGKHFVTSTNVCSDLGEDDTLMHQLVSQLENTTVK